MVRGRTLERSGANGPDFRASVARQHVLQRTSHLLVLVGLVPQHALDERELYRHRYRLAAYQAKHRGVPRLGILTPQSWGKGDELRVLLAKSAWADSSRGIVYLAQVPLRPVNRLP